MERRAERPGCAESDIEGDFCNWRTWIGQQGLCVLNAPPRPVALRRLPEGPLEGSQEMIWAQSHQIGQRVEGYILCEMLFHEIDDAPLLPAGKSATVSRL